MNIKKGSHIRGVESLAEVGGRGGNNILLSGNHALYLKIFWYQDVQSWNFMKILVSKMDKYGLYSNIPSNILISCENQQTISFKQKEEEIY